MGSSKGASARPARAQRRMVTLAIAAAAVVAAGAGSLAAHIRPKEVLRARAEILAALRIVGEHALLEVALPRA